jgi:hypothetical protein
MITGRSDPPDGRQTLLSLTDYCRHWLTKGPAARENWLSRRIKLEFSTEEQAQLEAAMPLLQRLINE